VTLILETGLWSVMAWLGLALMRTCFGRSRRQ
jgi:hypothetical protein